MSRITGKNGKIMAEATRTAVTVDTTMVDSGDHQTYSYHSLWDSSRPPTIKVNGSVVHPSLYTVNFINGTVTFATPNLISDTVTVNNIEWVTVANVADIYNWTAEAKIDLVDATAFQDQYKFKLSSFRGWTAMAEAYHRSDFWFPLWSAAKPCYIKLYPDAGGTEYFIGNGFVDFAEKAPSTGAVADSVKIEGTGALERRTS